MAVPKNDFYTLVGDNRYDSAPRSFPYDPFSNPGGGADWSQYSILQPETSPLFSDHIHQGELVALGPIYGAILRWNGDNFNLTFLGVARDSAWQYKRSFGRLPARLSVWTSGIHMLRASSGGAGQFYSNGDPVSWDTTSTDTDKITLGGGPIIGRVCFPPGFSDPSFGDGVFLVAAGSNIRLPILIDGTMK